MVGGYASNVLRVNLTTGNIKKENLDIRHAKLFLGGKGLGAKILYDELGKIIDPLSPENVLIFATGPLTGTLTPGGNKFSVVTISPMTNGFLDSNCGGFFGPELKFAGYDAVIIEGKSKEPVYLWIDNDSVELRSAKRYWGKDTHTTENAIKKELNDQTVRVACIGPAGENKVRFACITADYYRQAGRGGAGAVMGSKNLKAVVTRGNYGINLFDKVKMLEVFKQTLEHIYSDPSYEPLCSSGTTTASAQYSEAGVFTVKNFSTGVFDGIYNFNDEALRKKYVKANKACFNCPERCGQLSVVEEGPFKATVIGPEYETQALIGGNCGLTSASPLIKANLLCDKLGLDTMSLGGVVAFAMECFGKNILSLEDTDGIELRFGNGEALCEVIKKIAKREGIGDLLAEGTKLVAEKIGQGTEKFAIHVKGLDLAGYEPRGLYGMALAYATADRGGCHNRACPADDEIAGTYGDRLDPESYIKGKGELIKLMQDEKAWKDSIGICIFPATSSEKLAELLSASTGWNIIPDELNKIGERVYNLTRLINYRQGMSRKDDTLPRRMLEDPLPEGKSAGMYVKPEHLNKMLDDYYAARNWNKDGRPTVEKLRELNL